ncbi:hypothetical protein [Polymorphum gilvum]|uniref:Uncharacterized protein n=1 Tax=Polymorphum gilvum (strain LMG 25793 / CGMCC 1.9160 / SL003B-26A1) TaxID=991905 RepID=F2IWA1_POLGS|nr:hypothetical protein [Polymorphum gilvum]ADZ71486.1 hypothetical protein SL003B_3063 [Polymorphum gilvum SL003B-26A1]
MTPLAETSLTRIEVDDVMTYLRAALARAIRIRENAPAGSYLDSVLTRTIEGLEVEIAQLRYLLAEPDLPPAPPEPGAVPFELPPPRLRKAR